MTTSLSRQLSQLKTASTTAFDSTAIQIVKEADSIDKSTLTVVAKKSFRELVHSTCPELISFGESLFPDDPTFANEGERRSELSDIFYVLNPCILQKPTQWLLQYLVTVFEVHRTHSVELFFAVLPFYDYEIFARVVQSLPLHLKDEKYPNWLQHFRTSCFPTSQFGLIRHLGSDFGFLKLMTDMILKYRDYALINTNHSFSKITHFYASFVMSALNNVHQINENQVHSLIRVILAGLKAHEHREFRSCSYVLLTFLLPRLSLKSKVVNKILKSLGKSVKNEPTRDSFALFLILYRSQRDAVDPDKIRRHFAKHRFILDQLLEDENNRDYKKVILETLTMSLLDMTMVTGSDDDTETLIQLLDMIYKGVSRGACTVEAAKALVSKTSQVQIHLKGLKKVLTNQESRKPALNLCKKVLGALRLRFPFESAKFSYKKSSAEADILFMDESNDSPTDSQISAKRILLDNEFVNTDLSERILDYQGIRKLQHDVVKRNKDSVLQVLSQGPEFLSKQMEPSRLLHLTINASRIYKKATILEHVVTILTHKRVIDSTDIDLELVLLPLLFPDYETNFPISVRLLSTEFSRRSALLSVFVSVVKSEKLKLEDYRQKVWQRCSQTSILDYVEKVSANFELYQDPGLLGFLILNSGSNNFQTLKGLTGLLKRISDSQIEISSLKKCNAEDPIQLIGQCRRKMTIPVEVIRRVLNEILKSDKSFDDKDKSQFDTLLKEFAVLSSKLKIFGEIIDDFIETWSTTVSNRSYDQILADIACMEGISSKVTIKSLKKITSILTEDRNAVKRFIAFDSYLFPRVLANAVSGKVSKVSKLSYGILEVIHTGKLKSVSSSGNFLPFIKFVLDHRTELEADPTNVGVIISHFKDKHAEMIVNALCEAFCILPSFVFKKVCGFLSISLSESNISTLANFGLNLIVEKDEVSLAPFLDSFLLKMLPHIRKDSPSCKFFWTLLTSSITSMAVKALEILAQNPQFTTEAMFSQFIDLSVHPEASSETLTAVRDVIDSAMVENNRIIAVDCIVSKLNEIWGGSEELGKNRQQHGASKTQDRWVKTHFLLESVLRRSTLESAKGRHLLNPLFALLKKSLYFKDNDCDNSYSRDLILSNVLHVIDQMNEEDLKSSRDCIDPETLVHCIRNVETNTSSKGTAMLILAKASVACDPEYVLHNSIPIFTFVGGNNDFVIKADSKHCFEIACKAIDIIIPHLQGLCKGNREKRFETGVQIITTFSDASLDMPSHRFKTFLHKLIALLGSDQYLWIFTVQMLAKLKKTKGGIAATSSKRRSASIESQLMDLFEAFPIRTQVSAALSMTVGLKEDTPKLRRVLALKENVVDIRDDLDLLRLRCLTFVGHLLTSTAFQKRVLMNEENDANPFKELLEGVILNLDWLSTDLDGSKIHKHLMTQCERVLEASLNILPSDVLITVLKSLLMDKKDCVRRKSLEVLNSKLASSSVESESSATYSLIPSLLEISTNESSSELDFNRQMALLAIRSLAKRSSSSTIDTELLNQFKSACKVLVSNSYLQSLNNANVIASTLLCVVEIFTAIGPHAVSSLSRFVEWILNLFQDRKLDEDDDVVLNSVILAIQKLMDHFVGFLSPFHSRFVFSSCLLDHTKNRRVKNLLSTLAKGIPTLQLLSICQNCFESSDDSKDSKIRSLLMILSENLASLDKGHALAISSAFMDFFSTALKYKSLDDDRRVVEGEIIETFLSVTLKLPLDDFKPLFYRILNLSSEDCDRITIFHLVLKVAERLKSLFGFVAEPVVSKAVSVLTNKSETATLVYYILDSLSVVFAFNKVDAIIHKNYEETVNVILSYYEVDDASEILLQKLNQCVKNLSNSTEDDSQWKYLHYQVLLNLRSSRVTIRKSVLDLISLFLDGRGDGYMGVLPDAVPFLTETMEDEDKEVEKMTKSLLKKMEEVFGQSIEHYFEM